MAKSTKNRDLLSIIYGTTGNMWRNSVLGHAVKTSITNPVTKGARDVALSKAPEHYKRFAQYLTGGTRGDVTKLSPEIIEDIAKAKERGQHVGTTIHTYAGIKGKPGSEEYNANVKAYLADKKAGATDKELMKYYEGFSPRTHGSIGSAQLTPNKDDTHTLTDIYDVDHDPDYKPLRGTHYDLQEGTLTGKPTEKHPEGRKYPIGSRLYDAAKWFGTTGDFNYNVKINNEALKIKKRYNKDNLKL